MSIIDHKDLEPIQSSFRQRLWAAQEALCKEVVAGLEGRQVLVERSFRTYRGEWVNHTVAVSITDARLGHDDELVLVGNYAHPINGRIQETEVSL